MNVSPGKKKAPSRQTRRQQKQVNIPGNESQIGPQEASLFVSVRFWLSLMESDLPAGPCPYCTTSGLGIAQSALTLSSSVRRLRSMKSRRWHERVFS